MAKLILGTFLAALLTCTLVSAKVQNKVDNKDAGTYLMVGEPI